MIVSLRGKLTRKDPSGITIDVDGVGYGLAIPVSTLTALPEVGEHVVVQTFQYVREDTLALFGFATEAERGLFEQLLSVSGIGPKVALAILSLSTPPEISSAIASGDTAFLSSVPGIGKKTAERVVVDLRDKVGATVHAPGTSNQNDVIAALMGLGYSVAEARKAVQKVDTTTHTDEALRQALKELAA